MNNGQDTVLVNLQIETFQDEQDRILFSGTNLHVANLVRRNQVLANFLPADIIDVDDDNTGG